VLVDKFLEDAVEVDVDAVRDASGETLIGAVMEHVEEAGVHSGDSACVVPPPTLGEATVAVIGGHTRAIADALEVKGPLNVQFAVQRGPEGKPQVFVIEANPRASRTVPFVSKATGVPLAKVAARVMAGATLASLRVEGLLRPPVTGFVSVKEAVLPFDRFPDADSLLGPEMRSTGEVMGIDRTFGLAFAKSQLAAGDNLADGGTVFFSVADRDKPAGLEAAARFVAAGFTIAATSGTAEYLEKAGVPVGTIVGKVTALELGSAAGTLGEALGAVDAVELIRSGKVQLVVNTPRGRGPRADGARIRRAAHQYKVPLVTTVAAARAAAAGVLERGKQPFTVKSLQEHHGRASGAHGGSGGH
jgi:carbamoyl-phosphate synthase large subunit